MAKNVYIDGFVEEYSALFKEYEKLADHVRDLIKKLVKSKGIMAIVTARAKDPDRLKTKLEKMGDERIAEGKQHYQSVQEVAESIHDLIGARIALYFPTDADRIVDVLADDFIAVGKIKVFPPKVPNYDEIREQNCTAHMRKIYPGYDGRRFDGYHATHHRVRLQEAFSANINPDIEVQVASVLMHAWSEVEHDLAYKKMMGDVSREEYECLDEINGLVIAGEIALNRLNQLSQQRIQAQEKFDTVFMLKNYLAGWLRQRGVEDPESGDPTSKNTGNVDLLFNLYQRKNMLTREQVAKELRNIEHLQLESLPELVYWMTEWYKKDNRKLFSDVVLNSVTQNMTEVEHSINAKLGAFLGAWNQLEDRIRKILRARGFKGSNGDINWRYVVQERQLDEAVCERYYNLRLARNRVVHANRPPSLEKLIQLEDDLKELNALLDEQA